MVKGYMRYNNKEVEKTAIGWIILWSDSFAVHWSKQNNNCIWIFNVTICQNQLSFLHFQNTHNVWQWDHPNKIIQKVINHYIKQMEQIRSGQKSYCGLKKKISTLLLICWLIWPTEQNINQLCIHWRKADMDWDGNMNLG